MDLGLPDVDGYEFLASILGDHALESMTVVVVTGRALNTEVAVIKELNPDHLIIKPMEIDQLRSILDIYLDRLPGNGLRGEDGKADLVDLL